LKRASRITLALVLAVGLVASLGGISSASGPAASAAKKCKKGYKKNKKGKCVKKKFKAKPGLYTSSDGQTRLRVIDGLLYGHGRPKHVTYVRLFGTPPATLNCTDGNKTTLSIGGLGGPSATAKGKSFKFAAPPNSAFTLKGKFTSTKALKGTYTMTTHPSAGVTCASGKISFKAKWKSA
jgi:hypothetical protein